MGVMRMVLPALVALVTANRGAAAPQYIIHDLGLVGGTNARLNAINNNNVAAGSVSIGGGEQNAVVYGSGAWQLLGRGAAAGINDSGMVVGTSPAIGGMGQAWYWDGQRHDFASGHANAVNNPGHIAGAGPVPGNGSIWRDGAFTPLGTLAGGSYSEGLDVNILDHVVGWADYDALHYHAVIWDGITLRDIGMLLGRAYSRAVGINDQGLVIGWGQNSGSSEDLVKVGFLYDGQMHELPFVPTGINNKGQIVGGGGLYDSGVLYPLPGLSGELWGGPLAINENGWIVGYARETASGASPSHAVIWEPVPEPGSLAALGSLLAGFGLAALARLRA